MITCFFENNHKAGLRHVVVHAICENNSLILLEKRSLTLSDAPGKWCLPGGFLDRDETADKAVLRELLEETGWQGKVISFFRVNTNPQRKENTKRQNVALEFIVKPLKQVRKPDLESSEIKWWPISDLSQVDFAFDHAETVKLYLKYRQKPFPLPILDSETSSE